MCYVSVVLPLSLPGTFTYHVPGRLVQRVRVGVRVVVPFGKRHSYTAIVTEISQKPPEGDFELKEVAEVIDAEPVVLPAQLKLWQWISYYYMCTLGEVMKAALPAGMKMESETRLVRNKDFDADEAELSPKERQLLAALHGEKPQNVAALERELHSPGLLPVVRRLVEKEAVVVWEAFAGGFKPHTETHVRLAAQAATEPQVHEWLDKLHRAPAQLKLFETYLQLSEAATALTLRNLSLLAEVDKAELLRRAQVSGTVFSELSKKGVLEVYPYETGRLKTCTVAENLGSRPLNDEQTRALSEIHSALAGKDVCLLHGVTSSGKTEVYIRLIEEQIEAGRQVLYLLPEIALTTQITTRLGRVFGAKMGVYHSKFPDAERVEVWRKQLSPQPFPLILGVRSALFLPFRDLGLVIVDEEHETSYKQQDPAPRYHARDAAIVLARQCGAKVLLGTATPAFETFRNALGGKYGIVRMDKRYGDVCLPEIVVEDVKELRRKKLMKTPFSPRLTEEVRAALEHHGQAILFQNRRGYAPVMECHTCGWTPRCTRCDVSLTYHRHIEKLVCHYCGATYDLPLRCPACGGTELLDVGYGTEKIEAAAQAVFPAARTARLDLDTTRSRTAYEKIIDDFQKGTTDLLIGTQMVTKGLDFDRVRVVGILNADQMLHVADFRAYERAFQMMSQVAGRAGRRGKRGLVVLQTRQPELPLVRQVVEADYGAMYHEQMEEREAFRYPPFVRLINLMLKHKNERTVEAAAGRVAELLRPHFGTDILGPDRPSVGRVQAMYIRKLVLKVSLELPLQGVRRTLEATRAALAAVPAFKSVTFYFDVDPL